MPQRRPATRAGSPFRPGVTPRRRDPHRNGANAVVPPTAALLLAQRWARHRHDRTSWGSGDFGGARPEQLLRIHHGTAPIFVRDLGKCIMVLGVIDVPEDVRDWFVAAPPAERGRFLSGLREVLMACPRIGFSSAPSDLGGTECPERVALDQTLQIAENDAASFNRFCDAVQETETVLLMVVEYLRATEERAYEKAVYSSSLPPPKDLYL